MSTHVPRVGVSCYTPLATVLFAGCVLSCDVGAQSCVAPQMLVSTTSFAVDTCASSYQPQSLCDGAVPAGPAAVFRVNIGYPGLWTFQVTPGIGPLFDPAIAVISRQCETGACPRAADEAGPGGTEQVNLDFDSGVYYLIVTSFNPSASCGIAQISLFERTGGDGSNYGIFRASFEY